MGHESRSIGAKPRRRRVHNRSAPPQVQAADNQPEPPSGRSRRGMCIEFGDGIVLAKDWRLVPFIVCEVIKQSGATCWAIVLCRLLQGIFNLNQENVRNYKEFLHEDLVKHLVLNPKKKVKKTSPLALSNIQAALKHIYEVGLLKIKSSRNTMAGSEVGYKARWKFTTTLNAEVDFVKREIEESPIGIAFDLCLEFDDLKKGIYTVRVTKIEQGTEANASRRHMLIIVGYGYTKERELFFVVQNSWGHDWGVEGFGRIMIDDHSNFLLIYPC